MQPLIVEAKQLTRTLVKKYHPQQVILFGSGARGTNKKDSDIDLLIIKKSDKKKAYRIKEIFEALRNTDRHYPLDPLVYTPEELKERIALGDYFIKRILSEGKTLYG